MENKNGSGIIGVFQYPTTTGLFLVLPTEEIGELKEGFYPVNHSQNLYTNFNPQLLINKHGHVTLEKMEELTKSPITGMSIAGLMTAPIWGYKKHKNGLFY